MVTVGQTLPSRLSPSFGKQPSKRSASPHAKLPLLYSLSFSLLSQSWSALAGAMSAAASNALWATASAHLFPPPKPHPATCKRKSIHRVLLTLHLSTTSARFLHLDFASPADVVRPERVRIAWSIIRRRHPLLRSKVVLRGNDVPILTFVCVITVHVPP